MWFDIDDMDAAIAELDAAHARFEAQRTRTASDGSKTRQAKLRNVSEGVSRRGTGTRLADVLADDMLADDRRRVVDTGIRRGRQAAVADIRIGAEVGSEDITSTVIATRGERIVP